MDRRLKVWQRLLRTQAPCEIKALTIINSPVFAPQRIELCRAVAFIGLHGTGKTLILRMLEAAFGHTWLSAAPPFIRGDQGGSGPLGIEGSIEIELQTPSGLIRRRVDLGDSADARKEIWAGVLPEMFGGVYASPLYLFSELGMLYQEYNSVSRERDGAKELDLSRARTQVIGEILGKAYDRIVVRPDPILDRNQDPLVYVPYVAAYVGDQKVDSAMMSQGELWVHYILGAFFDHEITNGDLALLDEPEAFLAARAQRPFIDEVARQVLDKELQLIVGTHSPEVLARFPLENIRMCISGDGGIRVIKPRSIVQVRENVGLETAIRILILVEDELAAAVLHNLFAYFDTALNKESEVVAVGGESMVIKGLQVLRAIKRLGCIGVLDADQKLQKTGTVELPVFFLPGIHSPEVELISAISRSPDLVAGRLSVTADDIRAAISLCTGMDHQYWLQIIAGQLGLRESVLLYELMQVWLRDDHISEQAEILMLGIRRSIVEPAVGRTADASGR